MTSENDRKAVMEAVARVQAHYFRRIKNTRHRAASVPTENEGKLRQGFDIAKKMEIDRDSLGES